MSFACPCGKVFASTGSLTCHLIELGHVVACFLRSAQALKDHKTDKKHTDRSGDDDTKSPANTTPAYTNPSATTISAAKKTVSESTASASNTNASETLDPPAKTSAPASTSSSTSTNASATPNPAPKTSASASATSAASTSPPKSTASKFTRCSCGWVFNERGLKEHQEKTGHGVVGATDGKGGLAAEMKKCSCGRAFRFESGLKAHQLCMKKKNSADAHTSAVEDSEPKREDPTTISTASVIKTTEKDENGAGTRTNAESDSASMHNDSAITSTNSIIKTITKQENSTSTDSAPAPKVKSCGNCNRGFKTDLDLQFHQRDTGHVGKLHAGVVDASLKIEQGPSDPVSRYCFICGQACSNYVGLEQHLRNYHLSCVECGQYFETSQQRDCHLKVSGHGGVRSAPRPRLDSGVELCGFGDEDGGVSLDSF